MDLWPIPEGVGVRSGSGGHEPELTCLDAFTGKLHGSSFLDLLWFWGKGVY